MTDDEMREAIGSMCKYDMRTVEGRSELAAYLLKEGKKHRVEVALTMARVSGIVQLVSWLDHLIQQPDLHEGTRGVLRELMEHAVQMWNVAELKACRCGQPDRSAN
jgi:hypothetical protein